MVYTKLLVLLLAVAVTKGQSIYNSSTVHADEYISANKRNFAANIQDYDNQLKSFSELYNGRIDTIDIQLDFLISSLKQADERLYALEVLSDFSKDCVNKYIYALPSTAATTAIVQNCSGTANNMLSSLVAPPLVTRNNLKSYYDTNFEMGISNCGNYSNSSSQLNYTLCITTVVSDANTFTINNRKTFDSQMDAAKCSANGLVKSALDCSYTAQSSAMSLISGTNTLIDRCIQGADCSSCTGYYCENVERMPSYMINNKNQTMTNPFYGRNDTLSCLMLDIV